MSRSEHGCLSDALKPFTSHYSLCHNRLVTKKVKYFCAIIGLFLIVIAVAMIPEREPGYMGRSLSLWLSEAKYDGPEFEIAIQTLSTNSFPFLLRRIRKTGSALNWMVELPKRLGNALRLRSFSLPEESTTDARAEQAVRAFKSLGFRASPLVPELAGLAKHSSPNVADRALRALAFMGSNGIPSLIAAMRDPRHPYRGRASAILGTVELSPSNADTVVSELVASLKDPAINQSAADALGALKARPDIAVPALENALRDTNATLRAIAANSLIWFENRAQPALPSLSNALVDPNPDVRQAATNAIQQISFSLRRTQKR